MRWAWAAESPIFGSRHQRLCHPAHTLGTLCDTRPKVETLAIGQRDERAECGRCGRSCCSRCGQTPVRSRLDWVIAVAPVLGTDC